MLISTSINNKTRDIFYYYFIYQQDLNSTLIHWPPLPKLILLISYSIRAQHACLSQGLLWLQHIFTSEIHLIMFLHLTTVLCCTQSCLMLCNHLDWSRQGFYVPGISQARILEWVAVSYSRGSSWPRDPTHVSCSSCIVRWVLYLWTT